MPTSELAVWTAGACIEGVEGTTTDTLDDTHIKIITPKL